MVNSPAAAFHKNLLAKPPLYGEFDDGGHLKQWANLDIEHCFLFTSSPVVSTKIKCHNEKLDRFNP